MGAADIVAALTWYGWAGAAAAAVFLTVGLDRVDPSARGSFLFRLAILPGVIVLWPAVLIRWAQLERRRSRSAEDAG